MEDGYFIKNFACEIFQKISFDRNMNGQTNVLRMAYNSKVFPGEFFMCLGFVTKALLLVFTGFYFEDFFSFEKRFGDVPVLLRLKVR
jgi:hypothetical protein